MCFERRKFSRARDAVPVAGLVVVGVHPSPNFLQGPPEQGEEEPGDEEAATEHHELTRPSQVH